MSTANSREGFYNYELPHPLHWRQRLRGLLAAASQALWACQNLTTKGDISEIEVWQLITSAIPASSIDELDYDTLSCSNLPVRGELLGVLDLTAKPNSTTVDFACPRETDSLIVEMRCQRVACHVSFMQIEVAPTFGFDLVRRKE